MHTLIIAEGALELVNYKDRVRLLDRSYHHNYLLSLKDGWKRGRPDLIHISLLSVTSTPLYREGLINLYLHTYNDKVIVLKNVRLPRTYARFEGLMVDLFKKRRITNGDMLLEVYDMSFNELLDLIKPNHLIGLSRLGEASTAEYVAGIDSAIVVGGFPRGHFSSTITRNLNELLSISKYPLDTHVVCSRIVYEIEKRLIG